MPPSFPEFETLAFDPNRQRPGNYAIDNLDWTWAIFGIAMLMDIGVIVFSMIKTRKNALFNQIAIMMLSTTTIAWYAIASEVGYSPLGGTNNRTIYYVRYIQYFINMPLQVLLLVLGTGFPLTSLGSTIFLTAAAVICGLVGALVTTNYKWGFFAIGIIAMLLVLFHLYAHVGRSKFPSPSGVTRQNYCMALSLMAFLWIMYPIAWGCSEGGRVIDVSDEIIWYGILDTLTFPVWLAYFLITHRNATSKYLDVGSGKYTGATPLLGEETTERH